MCLDCGIVEAVAPYHMSWWPLWTMSWWPLLIWFRTLGPKQNCPFLKHPKMDFFFCIQRWMRGPCPSIKMATVEKLPPNLGCGVYVLRRPGYSFLYLDIFISICLFLFYLVVFGIYRNYKIYEVEVDNIVLNFRIKMKSLEYTLNWD